MRLVDWMKRHKIEPKEMAARITVRVNSFYRYMKTPGAKDFRRPEEDVMERIYRETDGDVTPNDFYNLPSLTLEKPSGAAA